MSDRSSESSCEWVILNENEDLLENDNEEQPLNLQLSYEAVCDAVSESIRSSLSGEELEWQYEQFHDYIPLHGSGIQELDYSQLDTDFTDGLDVIHDEGEDSSICGSASGIQNEKNIDNAHVKKIHCYKHQRNEHFNFVLNLLLALTVASAVGLGVGHFLGWSHKCFKSTNEQKAAFYSNVPAIIVPSSKPSSVVTVKQIAENFEDKENQVMSPLPFSENLSDATSWESQKGGSKKSCEPPQNNAVENKVALSETSIIMTDNVLELKTEEVNQNNSSGIEFPLISNIITNIDWNNVALISEPLKDLNEQMEKSGFQDVYSTNSGKSIIEELSFWDRKEEPSLNVKKSEDSFGIGDNLAYEKAANNDKLDLFEQFYTKEKSFTKESNLTNQLRHDFSEVIQSLSAIVLTQLTHVSDNYPLFIESSEEILKYYGDFENLVNSKLSEIDNFVLSSDFKKYDKISLKHLQKMVYSLVDSVDHLMKTSLKAVGDDNRKINAYKFSSNISRVIFNFNKKWDKNNRYWLEAVEKFKFQEIKYKNVKDRYYKKENKNWKKKAHFEKEYRNNKYKKYSFNS